MQTNFQLATELECMKKRKAFISLKDHKENLKINPAKSNTGKISKIILDKVNTHLRAILNVNQWRNTQNVIEWFGNTEQKSRHSFISFDIVDFYLSISENLLDFWKFTGLENCMIYVWYLKII